MPDTTTAPAKTAPDPAAAATPPPAAAAPASPAPDTRPAQTPAPPAASAPAPDASPAPAAPSAPPAEAVAPPAAAPAATAPAPAPTEAAHQAPPGAPVQVQGGSGIGTAPVIGTQFGQPVVLESWKNVTRGRAVIIKLDQFGQKRHEMVGAGKTFTLTPAERRINQEAAANEKLDHFLNGTLQPISLPDGTDFVPNPNHFDAGEETDIFKLGREQFVKRVKQIENPTAVRTLLETAANPATDAFVWQLEALKARYAVINDEPQHVKPGVDARLRSGERVGEDVDERPRAVTPA